MTRKTLWQGLGAFVYTGVNLTEEHVRKFAAVGGYWLVPVVYGDDVAGPQNIDMFPAMRGWCSKYGMRIGAWCNGMGNNPEMEAGAISRLMGSLNTTLVILDLEAAYQYPEGNANLMPQMLKPLRQLRPNADIGVSTNGMNASMIYNGRILTPPASFRDQRVRCLPQWYSSYYDRSGKTPAYEMKWLNQHGQTDYNFRDENAVNHRGLPLSYVHPTLEVTGLEGSSLAIELRDTKAAYVWGLTPGYSIYTLENMIDEDFAVLERVKGTMHLVA